MHGRLEGSRANHCRLGSHRARALSGWRLICPDGELVAVRVQKMGPTAARKDVQRSYDLPAGLPDPAFRSLEVRRVDHHQRAARLDRLDPALRD